MIDVPTNAAIDGLAARYGAEHVAVLNSIVSNDRYRMNAAHELSHILFGDCDTETETPDQDERAYEFASHLLVTTEMVKHAFRRKSMVDLLQYKERFGVSLASLIYRAAQHGFITQAEKKRLYIMFQKRGWMKNEPGTVCRDRSVRFESLVDSARLHKKVSMAELAEVCGVTELSLEDRLREVGATFERDVPTIEVLKEGEPDGPRLRLAT